MTPRHARPRWWRALRNVTVAGGIILAPIFLMVMWVTVTHLVRPSFGWLAWSVPAATEGAFLFCFAVSVLLLAAAKPLRQVVAVACVFAALSLALNVYSSWGHTAGMLGHAAVTCAFFTVVLVAEVAIRRLLTTDEQVAISRALADARRYAMDLLRDRKGVAWRWRPSVPSLLRRQVLSGRFPAAVTTAVRESLREYGEPWEGAVRDWALGKDGLNLAVQAEMASRKAVSDITREAAPEPHQSVPEIAPAGRYERTAVTPVRESSRARTKPSPRRMSDDELMPFARDALAADPGLSVAGMRRATGTGPERAKVLLKRAQDEERASRLAVAK